jgi:cullin 3
MSNSGLDMLIDMDKFEDLARLYRLFNMVPNGLPCLKRTLKSSIIRRGREINHISLGIETGLGENEAMVKDPGGAQKTNDKGKARAPPASQTLTTALAWVQNLLDLKDKMDTVWKKSFDSNPKIEATINEVSPLLSSSTSSVNTAIAITVLRIGRQ